MYRRFHDRFGTAGVVIGVIALIAALGGTAIAAGGLTGTQKKEVTKIAKKYAGKPGAPGAAGTPGTNGTNGKDGAPGASGAAGKSVTVADYQGEECEAQTATEEGLEVKVEGASTAKYVCDGEEGAPGADGDPWTVGGTLPSGATLTGAIAAFGNSNDTEIIVPISFSIHLAAPLDGGHVHSIEQANFTDFDGGGPGTVGCGADPTNPIAPKGHLCVYGGFVGGEGATPATFAGIADPLLFSPGASVSGAVITYTTPPNQTRIRGNWAVTAP